MKKPKSKAFDGLGGAKASWEEWGERGVAPFIIFSETRVGFVDFPNKGFFYFGQTKLRKNFLSLGFQESPCEKFETGKKKQLNLTGPKKKSLKQIQDLPRL